VVDPLISIFYRFFLAALILLIYSKIKRLNLIFNLRQHLLMALLGTLLFGFNYWLVYLAELHLKSGLVAVVFSTIIFLNIINGAIFLKSKIRIQVLTSAILGFSGISLLFKDELASFSVSSSSSVALLFAMVGAITASLGNITSAYNQKNKIPVVQANGFGMLYGSIIMLICALVMGTPIKFDFSFPYLTSLLYLSVFGSVVAFTSYLTLLGRIGSDKAAYVTLVVPVIALVFSTIFEEYIWSISAAVGVFLIFTGKLLVLRRRRPKI